jgi:hypothetical protein
MDTDIKIQVSDKLYLRDPEQSELGRRIVRQGIVLLFEMGFEQFTFRKLADAIQTTEASVYRYFENKHKLLLYMLAWYWNWLEQQVVYHVKNIQDPGEKLRRVIGLLCVPPVSPQTYSGIDHIALFHIVIAESNKTYLTKEVTDLNKLKLYKPYKDLCGRIANIVLEYNPEYPYPHSLCSTLIEAAHQQQYFMNYLPSLTDFASTNRPEQPQEFLEQVLFASIRK